MNLSEIRNTFIQYFKKNSHKEIKSSNLVPDNDPSLLFTNSGMVQFKNIFTGVEKEITIRLLVLKNVLEQVESIMI
jgi:alanyl-tRNA synthetase